jgi:hypothetical protein
VPSAYGIALDKEGTVWFTEMNKTGTVGKVDPKTLRTKYAAVPRPAAASRSPTTAVSVCRLRRQPHRPLDPKTRPKDSRCRTSRARPMRSASRPTRRSGTVNRATSSAGSIPTPAR